MESSNEFSVVEIIRGTFSIVYKNPILLLPQLILVIFYYMDSIILNIIQVINNYIEINNILLDINRYYFLDVFSTVFLLFFLIISPIIDAMYPALIKSIVDGRDLNLKKMFIATWKRNLSIWWASIKVFFIVATGFFLLIIPGLIFLAWYSYTIPAMMLYGLGASEGMSASKDFAKNKKLKTIILLSVIPVLLGVSGLIISYFFDMIPGLSNTVDVVFLLFYYTWMATFPAYSYLKYCQNPPLKEDKPKVMMANEPEITRTMQGA